MQSTTPFPPPGQTRLCHKALQLTSFDGIHQYLGIYRTEKQGQGLKGSVLLMTVYPMGLDWVGRATVNGRKWVPCIWVHQQKGLMCGKALDIFEKKCGISLNQAMALGLIILVPNSHILKTVILLFNHGYCPSLCYHQIYITAQEKHIHVSVVL